MSDKEQTTGAILGRGSILAGAGAAARRLDGRPISTDEKWLQKVCPDDMPYTSGASPDGSQEQNVAGSVQNDLHLLTVQIDSLESVVVSLLPALKPIMCAQEEAIVSAWQSRAEKHLNQIQAGGMVRIQLQESVKRLKCLEILVDEIKKFIEL